MSEAKAKSFIPLGSPASSEDDEDNHSPVTMVASKISRTSGTSGTVSPVPAPKTFKTGRLLSPAPGSLTPTGEGRIKAPPVCMAPGLKRAASSIDDFNSDGVCFTVLEAESCARKALMSQRKRFKSANVEEMPLNIIETCDPELSWKSGAESTGATAALSWLPEGKASVSSSSTVVTTSTTSSCGPSDEVAVPANEVPPMEEVRTDMAVNSEDEHPQSAGKNPIPSHVSGIPAAMQGNTPKRTLPPAIEASLTALSTTFTDNLIKEKSSRQGRSLQRWLVHSPTEELVRQVAGTIPITRDGRIILVSASRKTEWILPKGGWDEDETKEECAARETFEEAGLLGRLGGSLDPIDYESNKARKQRLSQMGHEGRDVMNPGSSAVKGDSKGGQAPPPKRVKMDKAQGSTAPIGPELNSSKALSSECTDSNGANCVDNIVTNSLKVPGAKLFDPKNYSYVRLFLFPLYVSSVQSDWPEKGRLRKLVCIDEAIEIMKSEKRLYFQRGLEMIKEQGLHRMNT